MSTIEVDRLNIITCLLERFSFDDISIFAFSNEFLIFNSSNNHYIRGNVSPNLLKTFTLSIGGKITEFTSNDIDQFIEQLCLFLDKP